jgi:predicted nucleotidyltransferase
VSESPPGLLPIFRSQHQLRLLGDLFIHSGRAFSIADLERRTGIPQQTLSREIDRLTRAGVVTSRQMGRMKLVEANRDSPYFPDLRSLLLKAVGPAEVIRDRLAPIPGIEEAYLFGSWAQRYEGELGPPPSDIDVLVIGDPDPDDVDAACRSVQRELGLEVNPVVLTRREWESGKSGFLRQIRRGPLVPLGKVPE